jgi:hypothetical protein
MLEILKRFIREEVERNLRWSAGFFGGGNIGKSQKGTVVSPLGGEEQNLEDLEKIHAKEKQKNRVSKIK